jgi:hypothetical protein
MLSLDQRPDPPALPEFSHDMQQFLLAAARADDVRERPGRVGARRYVAAGVAAVAGLGAAAIGIDHAINSPQSPRAETVISSGTQPSGGVHIHLAAFSVDTHPGGTVTVTLTQGQMFDPNALRQALAKAGVPALVTVGSVCTTSTPSDALNKVLSRSASGRQTVTTISPAAIPAGQKLSIGYFPVPNGGGLHISLVPDNAPLTCSPSPPAPPRHGSGPTR